jgi:uncharacterized repeat protein (TIGR03803 family)
LLALAVTLVSVSFAMVPVAPAQTESTLYNFGSTGQPSTPYSSLVLDSADNLYGTTVSGGPNRAGAVYKLALVSGAWQETTLYFFTGGADGGQPSAPPIFDAKGNLYGTASVGGAYGAGVVYKLSATTTGEWQQSVLYSFTGGPDGGYGFGNLVFDRAGNLYGSNSAGGNMTTTSCQNTGGCGVIFALSPTPNGKWSFHLLRTFTGDVDGVGPASLTFDASDHLFGSAAGAGGGFTLPNAPGLVFELTPSSSGPWHDSVVYSFNNGGGGLPSAVIFDKVGNMYGTGADGGNIVGCDSGYGPIGCGVVFKISPLSSGKWQETVLYSFAGTTDGSQPLGLVFDAGHFYGSTRSGAIFELSPAGNGTWNEATVFQFYGLGSGSFPNGPLVVDPHHKLYGTTIYGGGNSGGVAFELTP